MPDTTPASFVPNLHQRVFPVLVALATAVTIALLLAAGSPKPGLVTAAVLAMTAGAFCVRGQGTMAESGFSAALAALVASPVLFGAPLAATLALTLAALTALPLLGSPMAVGVATLVAGAIFARPVAAAGGEAVLAFAAAGSLQALMSAVAALARRDAMRERFDIGFLVRAMGNQGAIRLDFDVVRTETAIGTRLKQLQERMASLLRQVRGATQTVQTDAEALRAGGDQLRERTERSAAGLRDAAMTLEQITAIVQASADAAMQARASAVDASNQAREGAATFAKVAERMRDIDAAARRITDIVGVIDGIAFQTNILALNAAVEAARAGEHGRGFAVVAAEVRNLALRASQAAGEVKTLINASIETTRDGSELVREADVRIQELVQSVSRVGDVFAELSADTSQHAGSIDAVTRAVMELDELTQLNVALVETTQSVAARLQEHGARLEEQLSAFKVGSDPAPTTLGAPPAAAAPAAAERPSAMVAAAPAAPGPATVGAPATPPPATPTAPPAAKPAAQAAGDTVEFF